MWNLYGMKRGQRNLVATFDSEAQLRSYVQWATLSRGDDGVLRFEQKTPLTGCTSFDFEEAAREEGSPASEDVVHNPTPGML